MQQQPPPSQAHSVAFGAMILAVLPLWEVWSVLSTGSMAGVHCNGIFSGTLCAAGTTVGMLIFGAKDVHLGYALISGALGFLLLFFAGRAFFSTKQKATREASA
jgi:hypothetical protein